MRNYVIINGVNSNTINGLAINELPPITKPPMRVLQEEIDGRDGDITTNLGYGAYDKVMTIGLFHTFDINQIIAFFNDTGTIVFSNEPDKKYNYKIIDQIDYEKLISFKTATVTIHCQPFKYPLEEEPIEVTYTYVEGEGETLTLNNTSEAPMEIDLKGNTSQNGTPTPDTPIPVNVVTGDNTIEICGKNLAYDISYTNQTTRFQKVIGGTYHIVEGKKYAISFDTQNTGIDVYHQPASAIGIALTPYGVACDGTRKTFIGTATATGTFTIPSIIARATATSEVSTGLCSNFMIEEIPSDSSSSTEYKAYTGNTQLISLGVENLFDKNNITTGSFYVAGGTSSSDNWALETIPAKPNTQYYLSGNNYNNNVARIVLLDSSKSYLQDLGGYHDTHLITTSSTTAYIGLSVAIYSGSSDLDTLQLTKGTTPQHTSTTPIELCKIGDYQDYIYKDSNKWYMHSKVVKVILDGTEDVNAISNNMFQILLPSKAGDGYSSIIAKCNIFSVMTQVAIATTTNENVFAVNGDYVYIRVTSSTTEQQFKTLLSSNNAIIYYVLNTPTNTEITDTTLIGQLDNLQNLNSYNPTTNIMQENNDKPFILKVVASAEDSGSVVIDNIGNIYSKPTIALEGNGTGGIYLNDNQILSVELTDKMTISISDMEAFDPDTHALLNRAVTGNYNSMTLQPNENTIKITGGITKATITDYTRWL